MTSSEAVLSQYIDDWNAGRRPRAEDGDRRQREGGRDQGRGQARRAVGRREVDQDPAAEGHCQPGKQPALLGLAGETGGDPAAERR